MDEFRDWARGTFLSVWSVIGWLTAIGAILTFVEGARREAGWIAAVALLLLLAASCHYHVRYAIAHRDTRPEVLKNQLLAMRRAGEQLSRWEDLTWIHHNWQPWSQEAYALLSAALGPDFARRFNEAGMPPPGTQIYGDFPGRIKRQVAILDDVLKDFDAIPIMEDWQP